MSRINWAERFRRVIPWGSSTISKAPQYLPEEPAVIVRGRGCRVFFCDAAGGDWAAELYEEYHGRIRRLHARHRVDYHYVELTAALAELFPPARQ